jgi:hypothetical protein
MPIGGPNAGGACHDDIGRLCKDVESGGGRILQCLESHKADMSKGCKSAIQGLYAQLQKAVPACKPDVEEFCSDVPVGNGGIVQCLKKHDAEISGACKTAVAQTKKAKEKASSPMMEPPE